MRLKFGLVIIFLIFIFSLWPLGELPIGQALQLPNEKFWFGTDSIGRDLFYRLQQGTKVSLLIGIGTTFGTFVLGILFAVVSASFGGRADRFFMRVVEVIMALPSIILLAIIMLALQNTIIDNSPLSQVAILSFALILTSWPSVARQTRTLIQSQLSLSYIEAARAIGASELRVLGKHVLPNLKESLLVLAGLQIPGHLLFESYLSFVGLGMQPPIASWGVLIQEGWRSLSTYPHLILIPSLFLFITVLSFNLVFTRK